jgi:hypothetical protein
MGLTDRARRGFHVAAQTFLFNEGEKPAKERAAAGTTGLSRITAAQQRLLVERVRRLERNLPETTRVVRPQL